MKANLVYTHASFDRYFPPATHGAGFLSLADRLVGLGRRVLATLKTALHQQSYEEQYLAQSQNHADLERRLFQLQYARDQLPTWF